MLPRHDQASKRKTHPSACPRATHDIRQGKPDSSAKRHLNLASAINRGEHRSGPELLIIPVVFNPLVNCMAAHTILLQIIGAMERARLRLATSTITVTKLLPCASARVAVVPVSRPVPRASARVAVVVELAPSLFSHCCQCPGNPTAANAQAPGAAAPSEEDPGRPGLARASCLGSSAEAAGSTSATLLQWATPRKLANMSAASKGRPFGLHSTHHSPSDACVHGLGRRPPA